MLHEICETNHGQSNDRSLAGILYSAANKIRGTDAIIRPTLTKYMEVIDRYLKHSDKVGKKVGFELPKGYRSIRATLHEMLEENMRRLGIDEDAREPWLNDSPVSTLSSRADCECSALQKKYRSAKTTSIWTTLFRNQTTTIVRLVMVRTLEVWLTEPNETMRSGHAS